MPDDTVINRARAEAPHCDPSFPPVSLLLHGLHHSRLDVDYPQSKNFFCGGLGSKATKVARSGTKAA